MGARAALAVVAVQSGRGDAAAPQLRHPVRTLCNPARGQDNIRPVRDVPAELDDIRRESRGLDLVTVRRDRRTKCRKKLCSRSPWSLSLPLAPRRPNRLRKSPSSRPTKASSDFGAGRGVLSAPPFRRADLCAPTPARAVRVATVRRGCPGLDLTASRLFPRFQHTCGSAPTSIARGPSC